MRTLVSFVFISVFTASAFGAGDLTFKSFVPKATETAVAKTPVPQQNAAQAAAVGGGITASPAAAPAKTEILVANNEATNECYGRVTTFARIPKTAIRVEVEGGAVVSQPGMAEYQDFSVSYFDVNGLESLMIRCFSDVNRSPETIERP